MIVSNSLPDKTPNKSNNDVAATKNTTLKSSSLSYRDAGVDIDAGNELVNRIKPHVKSTLRPEVIGGLGGFGALFEIPLHKYKSPVLVSGTDGVGTKLKLAIETGLHDGIGIDLVAMCVNDLIVQGAEPLFFLDYYATAKLDLEIAETVIKSICEGCKQAGASLIGGETAEMPGMYANDDYDMAGFCVGIVEKEKIITGQTVAAGDVLIGLASSGPHSNGYSLIRKVLELHPGILNKTFEASSDKTFGDILLTPTRIYVKSVLSVMQQINIKSIAHITGGGLSENLPRVMPEHLTADITLSSWTVPAIFLWLQEQGNINQDEMLRTFNCGIGLVLCVSSEDANNCIQSLNQLGETAYQIGTIIPFKQAAVLFN